MSFPPIVAAGAHGALPHAMPRDVEIPRGVLVVVDLGARLDGYCSDCTRTLATGPLDDREREAYEGVLEAQEAAVDAVRAGADCRAVDAAAREAVEGAAWGSASITASATESAWRCTRGRDSRPARRARFGRATW